jgi:hypothetical protein
MLMLRGILIDLKKIRQMALEAPCDQATPCVVGNPARVQNCE